MLFLYHFGRAQSGTFEHKIEVFVLFGASGPQFSGVSSTKTRFMCAFRVLNPRFRAFRVQNRYFCVRIGDFSCILGRSKHKIGIFVRYSTSESLFSGFSSTKVGFLCAIGLWNRVAATALYLFMVPALGVRPQPWMLMKPICHNSKLLLALKLEFDGRW